MSTLKSPFSIYCMRFQNLKLQSHVIVFNCLLCHLRLRNDYIRLATLCTSCYTPKALSFPQKKAKKGIYGFLFSKSYRVYTHGPSSFALGLQHVQAHAFPRRTHKLHVSGFSIPEGLRRLSKIDWIPINVFWSVPKAEHCPTVKCLFSSSWDFKHSTSLGLSTL